MRKVDKNLHYKKGLPLHFTLKGVLCGIQIKKLFYSLIYVVTTPAISHCSSDKERYNIYDLYYCCSMLGKIAPVIAPTLTYWFGAIVKM